LQNIVRRVIEELIRFFSALSFFSIKRMHGRCTMKTSSTSLWVLALSVLGLTACYQPGGPVPEAPVDPAGKDPIPSAVIAEEVLIQDGETQYPRENGEIPAGQICGWDCDAIRFTRYRPEAGGAVNAVLVLIPGFMGGANSFDYIGRQLVSMAEADEGVGRLEVWAVDRRTNCLEDLTGMNAAEDGGDPGIAVDYYYNDVEVGGKTFQGFLGEGNAPFLSEFGLKLLMDDIHKIITAMIPDQADRKATVFIGGHSAGGGYASYFAGWDRDGDELTVDDTGFNNCAGLIGLDGRVGARSASDLDETEYVQRLADIRSGAAPRLNLLMGVTPEALSLFEIVGMSAHMFPDDESILATGVPYSGEVASLIRLLHSRDLTHYLTGIPALGHFRYTNEAALGIFFDDNFNPVSILQTSMGFLQGGAVVPKDFPGKLAELLGLFGIVREGLFIPWDAGESTDLGNGPLYSWVDFDEVGNALDPDYQDTTGTLTYTNWREEMVDIQDVAVSLYWGDTNFPEWYYTTRIGLDSQAASTPYGSSYGLNFLHNDRIEDLPLLNINASDREGYNHQDVLFAAADRPSHRPSEVLEPMMQFVFANSSGSVEP
jgi:pimeloyl-ACP methyl ester carboxylesterase